MLIDFTVENYRSIREPVTLSLLARNSLSEYSQSLFAFRKDRILSQVMILGANGAGKTSLLKALQAGIQILKNSLTLQPHDRISGLDPFVLDDHSGSKPSRFEYTMVLNGQRFVYGFLADSDQIVGEYLYSYSSSGIRESQSVVFERKQTEYYIPARHRKLQKLIFCTPANRLFLGVAYEFQEPVCQEIFEHLTSGFLPAFPEETERQEEKLLNRLVAGSLHHETLERLMQEADLGIEIENGRHGLSWKEESAGSRRFLVLLALALQALEEGKVMLVDDLEQGLHPLLMGQLTRLFSDPKINTRQAQLVFTAHDPLLLMTGHLRRDQILLVEKDRDTRTTQLYSLADFSPRREENILKNYLIGRYGAIPRVSEAWIDA